MSAAGDRPAEGGRRPGRGRPARRGQPFSLNVRPLRSRPGTRRQVHLEGPLPGMFVSSARVADDATVRFDGYVESTLGGVTVAGEVTAPWTGVCRRCLEPAEGEVVAEVRELCRDPGEAAWEEDEPYPVGHDELDLQPIVRDACILELPLAPLCSDGCLGLCPTCGANRNRDECSCDVPTDTRWSALAGLGSEPAEPSDPTEQEAE